MTSASYPDLPTIGARFAWARRSVTPKGGDTTGRETLAARLSKETGSTVHWMHLQLIEGNSLDPSVMNLVAPMAKVCAVDVGWLETGVSNRAPRVLPNMTTTVVATTPKVETLVGTAHNGGPRQNGHLFVNIPTQAGSLGEKVRNYRLSRNWGQAKLAAAAGVTITTVSRVELNKFSMVNEPSIQAVLAATGVSDDPNRPRQGAGQRRTTQHSKTLTVPEAVIEAGRDYVAAEKEAANNSKKGTPMPVPVKPVPAKSAPVRQTKGDGYLRPRQVTSIHIEADDEVMYLVCGRKIFKRDGENVASSYENIATLALSPALVKKTIRTLAEALARYEANS